MKGTTYFDSHPTNTSAVSTRDISSRDSSPALRARGSRRDGFRILGLAAFIVAALSCTASATAFSSIGESAKVHSSLESFPINAHGRNLQQTDATWSISSRDYSPTLPHSLAKKQQQGADRRLGSRESPATGDSTPSAEEMAEYYRWLASPQAISRRRRAASITSSPIVNVRAVQSKHSLHHLDSLSRSLASTMHQAGASVGPSAVSSPAKHRHLMRQLLSSQLKEIREHRQLLALHGSDITGRRVLERDEDEEPLVEVNMENTDFGNLTIPEGKTCWRQTHFRKFSLMSAVKCEAMGYDLVVEDCFEKCPPNHKRFGHTCIPDCNSEYIDGGVICYRLITKEVEGRGVGTIPELFCPDPDYELVGVMCVSQCPEGAENVLGVCWDDLKPSSVSEVRLPEQRCEANHEMSGGLCYPKCPEGQEGEGPFCSQVCKEEDGYKDAGLFCVEIKVKDIISQNAVGDPDEMMKASNANNNGTEAEHDAVLCNRVHEEKSALEFGEELCVSGCKRGFESHGPICWSKCPANYPVVCGIFACGVTEGRCARDFVDQTKGVFKAVAKIIAMCLGISLVDSLGTKLAVMVVSESIGRGTELLVDAIVKLAKDKHKEDDEHGNKGVDMAKKLVHALSPEQLKTYVQQAVEWIITAAKENPADILWLIIKLEPTGVVSMVDHFRRPMCDMPELPPL